MSAVLDRPVAPPGVVPPTRGVLALARIETRLLLRHPVTLCAVLLLVGSWAYGWFTQAAATAFPVLQNADRSTQYATGLLLGGSALIVSNLAVLRARRHHTEEFYDTLVLPAWKRTLAHLLALPGLAGLAALLIAARAIALYLTPTAVGRVDPYILAAGALAVIVLGAVGVLLARAVPLPIMAPLTLVGLGVAALAVVWPGAEGLGATRYLLPFVAPFAQTDPFPVALLADPTGRHLVYLCCATLLIGLLATIVGGARHRALPWITGLVLVATAATGALQYGPVPASVIDARRTATLHPSSQQRCETRGAATYCAFPDFVPWIGQWQRVVDGVLRRVPATARRPLTIRQHVFAYGHPTSASYIVPPTPVAAWAEDDRQAGTPGAVAVDTAWADSTSAVELAGRVAYRLVIGARDPALAVEVCGAPGVLVLWLTAVATPRSRAEFVQLDHQSHGGLDLATGEWGGSLVFEPDTIAVVRALLNQPATQVAARVAPAWRELTASGTNTARAAALLGAPPLPATDPDPQRGDPCARR